MTNIPILLMPVIALGGMAMTGALVYLMANSRRNHTQAVGMQFGESATTSADSALPARSLSKEKPFQGKHLQTENHRH